MPLDLEEDHLVLKEEDFAHALDGLDDEGRNANSAVSCGSWLGVLVMSTRFKEEILEL